MISCICKYCRHHFVFKISLGSCGSAEFPLHHFIATCSEWFDDVGVDNPAHPDFKLLPLLGRVLYECSTCHQEVLLEVTAPRLKSEWIQLIADEDRVRTSIRIAKEEEPDRFSDLTQAQEDAYATGALATLNLYLKNILSDEEDSEPRKKIAVRNKRFLLQFGSDCSHIFHYLGFEIATDYVEETREERVFWLPPKLPRQDGKTPLKSMRAFLQDVRSEVQSVLGENPAQTGQVVIPISAAREPLERALGCDINHLRPTVLRLDESETEAFWVLGATPDSSNELLRYAYLQQIRNDIGHKRNYLQALGKLAMRRDENLQMFVHGQQDETQQQQQKAASSGSDTAIDKAYAHFGLSRNCSENSTFFIQNYRTYREQSPLQKSEHRVALLKIGEDRKSQEILHEVYTTRMEPSEACSYLNVSPDWPLDNIAAFAQSSMTELDLQLTINALEAIALDRPSDDPSRPGFNNIMRDIMAQRDVMSISSIVGNTQDQSGTQKVDMALPVGLANLRNTCYLNSILQYFYSVNAVRDLALGLDQPPLKPTEEQVRNVLSSINSPDLETGRAYVGHEFGRELSILFRGIEASNAFSVSPRQRLANAALLRPDKLRPKKEAKAADVSAPGPEPSIVDKPPLPPRASEYTEPKVTVEAVSESSSDASDHSSQTLVNQGEDDPSYVVVDHAAGNTGDAAMEDVEMTDAAPEKAEKTEGGDGVKNSKLTVEELAAELDLPNVGSDQMDVDEVMGNAIDHLRAAFKVSRIGASGSAPDPIEEAFFSTFIDNRKKIGESTWSRATRQDRWVTAYPAKTGSRHLHEAMANSFDLEPLSPTILSFTTIERPAPHFHICIQRSEGIRKNANPIIIPETLYLDRWMHGIASNAALFHKKKREWDLNTRLNELTQPPFDSSTASGNGGASGQAGPDRVLKGSMAPKAPMTAPKEEGPPGVDEIDRFLVIGNSDILSDESSSAAVGSSDSRSNTGPSKWNLLSPALKAIYEKHISAQVEAPARPAADPIVRLKSERVQSPSDFDLFWDQFSSAQEGQQKQMKEELETIFKDAHEVAYRLHAVVCHAGSSASAGHYWVWIHDFEHDVWRKYNDTRVTVHAADYVFNELNTKGEPYYLSYVRATEINRLVSIPRRTAIAEGVPPDQLMPPAQMTPPASPKDVSRPPATQVLACSEHIEDVVMPDADKPPAYSA
ncbi:ubiquitin carboxyl-terminal hydrolase 2 [Diplogelasinospora grovesii]|uniref:ubiquitinyl hydrolase 1 n=1 Tax=Diplogelasinospora grovesii TaxID=303347 RepID=A0AAN6N8T3_9PEZI|nr:ubiquitin carboxyl-terminal hydrolase 2 [Diplogelasinospora grovesii]